MQKKVSVIIPVYNVEQFLDRCVESIVNQSYKNIEIILVDDGSPDNCPKLCDNWAEKDERIKVVHKSNGGLGFARNSGLEVATGDYVMFIDSDDYIAFETVEKCVQSAVQNNAQVVMFGRKDVYADGYIEQKKLETDRFLFSGREEIMDLLAGFFTYKHGMGVSAWGKLYELSLFKENGLFFKSEREIISEDAYFILEIFNLIECAVLLPENFYCYYKNDKSLSRTYRADRQQKTDKFFDLCLDYCKSVGYPQKIALNITARYHAFSLTAAKQTVRAQMPFSKKLSELKELYQNQKLINSLSEDVLSLETKSSALFWRLFKKKHLLLCYILLLIKSR